MMKPKEKEIIDTKITDQWGVNWTPMEIARDFLQNFYDDNTIDDIKIEIKGTSVVVSAPKVFDYKELLYLGSDKEKEKIGQYGEGFKAATLNALRNHNCIVIVIIRDIKLEFFFTSEKIGRTEKKVVKCKKTTSNKTPGTKLILEKCPEELINEFRFGLKHFYYDNNPLFGEILASTYEQDIFVYKSTDKNGYVFYKNLLRAKIGAPLVLVCNRAYSSVDKVIQYDRDRKAFDIHVLESIYEFIFRPLNRISPIVEFLQPWWSDGHKILSTIAKSATYFQKMQFPEKYYAKQSTKTLFNPEMIKEIEQKQKELRERDYIECPHYMSKLGMKNIITIIEEQKIRARKQQQEEPELRSLIHAIIDKLSEEQKSRLLMNIPEEQLLRILKKENISLKDFL